MKKSLTVKPLQQQAAFAAQNLEDMVKLQANQSYLTFSNQAIYGVIGDRCCECDRGMTVAVSINGFGS